MPASVAQQRAERSQGAKAPTHAQGAKARPGQEAEAQRTGRDVPHAHAHVVRSRYNPALVRRDRDGVHALLRNPHLRQVPEVARAARRARLGDVRANAARRAARRIGAVLGGAERRGFARARALGAAGRARAGVPEARASIEAGGGGAAAAWVESGSASQLRVGKGWQARVAPCSTGPARARAQRAAGRAKECLVAASGGVARRPRDALSELAQLGAHVLELARLDAVLREELVALLLHGAQLAPRLRQLRAQLLHLAKWEAGKGTSRECGFAARDAARRAT